MKVVSPILGIGLLLCGFSSPGFAATTLLIFQEPAQTIGPQSESAPCIIAGTTCQNGDFDYTNFTQTGNISEYDIESPTYAVEDFPFRVFDVAIDVNTNSAMGETLLDFEVFVNGLLEWSLTDDTNIGALSSNGNGWADWTLRSIDLSGLDPLDTVQFRANWSGASAGAESFFLIAADSSEPPGEPVPIPGTLGLLGIGLAGLGLIRARQR